MKTFPGQWRLFEQSPATYHHPTPWQRWKDQLVLGTKVRQVECIYRNGSVSKNRLGLRKPASRNNSKVRWGMRGNITRTASTRNTITNHLPCPRYSGHAEIHRTQSLPVRRDQDDVSSWHFSGLLSKSVYSKSDLLFSSKIMMYLSFLFTLELTQLWRALQGGLRLEVFTLQYLHSFYCVNNMCKKKYE